MTQRSMFWDGSSLGDAQALTVIASDGIGWRMANAAYVSPWVDRMSRALWNGSGNRGVLYGYANELAVTGAATPIQVDTGAGMIYGLFYENTAASNKVIATPLYDTRYDRIVVRRDWATQEARITVLSGIEGSGIPALTQSPAPSGSGIYDIPLATLEVTTAGAITVTDDREYCAFPTGFGVDAFATANIVDNAVDLQHRATRTRSLFLGGGDLQPNVNAGLFGQQVGLYLTQVGPPVWGGGAAVEEAWRTTGAVSAQYRGLYLTFGLPADAVPGTTINCFVWWVNNVAVAASFSIVTSCQTFRSGQIQSVSFSTTSTSITISGAVSDVYRSAAMGLNVPSDGAVGVVHYYIAFYNTAGTEDIGIMGLELQYTGYS